MLVERLDFGPAVRESLRLHVRALERQGLSRPTRQGEAIPLPMRIVHLSHDMEAIARLFSPDHALEAAATAATARTTRRSPTSSSRTGATGSSGSREIDPWDAVLDLEPEPRRMLAGDELDDALMVVADFIDLKSPFMGGHSRRCAAARGRRGPRARARRRGGHHAAPRRARARLRHDRRAELDLGQARPADASGVRPRRAPPDADRADAAPLAGPGRAEPGRVRAPREVRRLRLPQARCAPTPTTSARASSPRRRSTSG